MTELPSGPRVTNDSRRPGRWKVEYSRRLGDNVIGDWQEAYRTRLAIERSPEALHRLGILGTWPVVLVDLILLLVVEFMASFALLAASVAVIGSHDRDFSRGLSANDAMTTVLNSAKDWALSPTGLAIGELVTAAGILLVLFLRVVRPRAMTWADLGIGPALRDRPLRALIAGLGLGVVALLVGDLVVLIVHGIGLNTNGQEDTLKSVRHSAMASFIPFALAAAVTAPIVEETFFRGYVFRAMTVRYGLPAGIICSSVTFAALHLLGGVTWEATGLVVIGAILAYGYSRTGNPLTNMSAHMLNNVISLILLYYSS